MRITPQHIEAQIAATRYISRDTYEAMGTLTICILEMANGTKIVGQSACLDESTFDAFTGRTLARANAISKLWELEGYAAASQRAEVPPGVTVLTIQSWDTAIPSHTKEEQP